MKDELLPTVAINLAETLTEKLIEREVAQQRTFAILSCFDADKTTYSKKFLLCAVPVGPPGTLRKINQNLPCKSITSMPFVLPWMTAVHLRFTMLTGPMRSPFRK